jgi:hypothetical protein
MPATLYGEKQFSLSCECNCILYIGCPRWLHDQCRVAIDRFIQDAPSNIVASISWHQQIASQAI